MKDESFLSILIKEEIGGKNNAIHAYDRMIWTVRSGFLTLVFAGWSITIKSAIEAKAGLAEITPFVLTLGAFSLGLAAGAFVIDRNYARRKFRVIAAVNELMQIITRIDIEKVDKPISRELTELLQISGDAANRKHMIPAYANEILVSRIIYIVPSLLVTSIMLYYIIEIL